MGTSDKASYERNGDGNESAIKPMRQESLSEDGNGNESGRRLLESLSDKASCERNGDGYESASEQMRQESLNV